MHAATKTIEGVEVQRRCIYDKKRLKYFSLQFDSFFWGGFVLRSFRFTAGLFICCGETRSKWRSISTNKSEAKRSCTSYFTHNWRTVSYCPTSTVRRHYLEWTDS